MISRARRGCSDRRFTLKGVDHVSNAHPLAGAEQRIDARRCRDKRPMALCHTTGCDQVLTRRFAGSDFTQHVEGLFPRRSDEGTGIHDDHIGIVGVCDRRMSLRRQNADSCPRYRPDFSDTQG
jgi:hypothetical protein